jgi:N-acetylglucosaminyl-diphospho-decaprenol L-rhamnosyltransferase
MITENTMDLSIIIVNWNSTDYLRMCLASIYHVTKNMTFEVIVVDNASSDSSCKELIESEYPAVRLYLSKVNLGFAGGSNFGYDQSSGKALLFLNPDTEIRENVFPRMLQELNSNDQVGAVGVRLLNTDGSLQSSCVQTYPTIANQLLDSEFLRGMLPNSSLWGVKALHQVSAAPATVDVISGACLMVKREIFERAGKFDERFFMYVEDLDLCRRINGTGTRIHYLNDCEVIHHGGKSAALQGTYFANLRQQEAIVKYFYMTRGSLYSLAYRAGLAITAVLRLALIACLMPMQIVTRRAKGWKYSFEKWTCILRWALGLKMQPGQ